MIISCDDILSCSLARIQTTLLAKDVNLLISCDGEKSCKESIIDVTDVKSFSIFYTGIESCQSMKLYMDFNDNRENNTIDDYNNYSIIYCTEPEACNDLVIDTNSVLYDTRALNTSSCDMQYIMYENEINSLSIDLD